MSKKVILSSPLLLEDGRYERLTVTKQEAIEFAKDATNYCGHETVRVIGLDPAESRKSCEWYDEALVLQPKERLEWGRETLADCFGALYDDKVYVTFDFEEEKG